MTNFINLAENRWQQGKYLCIGLDVVVERLPDNLAQLPPEERAVKFCREIIDATADIVFGYKPNLAFFEGIGLDGMKALASITKYCKDKYPEIPLILDGKRGDIGDTNLQYAKSLFDELYGDAITVPPYMGENSLRPFLDREGKGIFVLCRTSNVGAEEFQDMKIDGDPIFVHVARRVSKNWRAAGTLGLVVGATFPRELARIRDIAPNIPILIPGIGAQGGDLMQTVEAAKRDFIINSSRGIIYASSKSDFAQVAANKAEQLSREIMQFCQRAH